MGYKRNKYRERKFKKTFRPGIFHVGRKRKKRSRCRFLPPFPCVPFDPESVETWLVVNSHSNSGRSFQFEEPIDTTNLLQGGNWRIRPRIFREFSRCSPIKENKRWLNWWLGIIVDIYSLRNRIGNNQRPARDGVRLGEAVRLSTILKRKKTHARILQ